MEKKKVKAIRSILLVVLALGFLGGCTRSLDATYRPGLDVKTTHQTAQTIGIAKFEDKRSFVRGNDKKSSSYIATQSPWQFGLTYNGQEFIPVSDFLQKVMVSEFNDAGFKALAIEAGDTSTDFVMDGKILSFEFANDAGVWTVTSRRTVTISVNLRRKDNSHVFAERNFHETSTEGEGMGVMHTTNVEKLMNIVLKKVLNNLAKEVSSQYAVHDRDVKFQVFVDGEPFQLASL